MGPETAWPGGCTVTGLRHWPDEISPAHTPSLSLSPAPVQSPSMQGTPPVLAMSPLPALVLSSGLTRGEDTTCWVN